MNLLRQCFPTNRRIILICEHCLLSVLNVYSENSIYMQEFEKKYNFRKKKNLKFANKVDYRMSPNLFSSNKIRNSEQLNLNFYFYLIRLAF